MPVFTHHFTTDLLLISKSKPVRIDNLIGHTSIEKCACILSRRGRWKITPPSDAVSGLMTLDPFECLRSRLSDAHNYSNKVIAIDTSVLVRRITRDEPAKNKKSFTLFRENTTYLSLTVLQEVEWVCDIL